MTEASFFLQNFQDCNLNDLSKMADSSSGGGSQPPFIPLSPPKCEVDDSPLQGKMLNKNKECKLVFLFFLC